MNDYSITLRVRHPNIAPEDITRQIGFEPQYAWRAGEPRRSDEEQTSGVYRESVWVGFLPDQDKLGLTQLLEISPSMAKMMTDSLPAASLYAALSRMKRALEFWHDLIESGGTIDCLVAIRQDDRVRLELSPTLASLLAELRVGLSVEIEATTRSEAAA